MLLVCVRLRCERLFFCGAGGASSIDGLVVLVVVVVVECFWIGGCEGEVVVCAMSVFFLPALNPGSAALETLMNSSSLLRILKLND